MVDTPLNGPLTGGMSPALTKVEAHILNNEQTTYAPYYNGKMSYKLHGESWNKYVSEAFPKMAGQITSENIFKTVIDLFAENLVPLPKELKGFANSLVPLLSRGQAPIIVLADKTVHFPEHFDIISDGTYTICAIFTRKLDLMEDYVTFAYSDGKTRLFKKPVPDDLASPDRKGYEFVEETVGNRLFRVSLDDNGFGPSLAALQDRVNHSIIDLTVIAEMYARPFWYLMNVEMPPSNPYLPNQPKSDAMTEQKSDGNSGRIFTTSSEGPFGQLEPPTISDMIGYHDTIIDKIPQSFGLPAHYLKPGTGTPPTGVALKVLSKRFNNRISRIRDDIEDVLIELCEHLGLEKTAEVTKSKRVKGTEDGTDGEETEAAVEYEYELWNTDDDLLQESLDAHGISLSSMGYPLAYIAEVVTPGVDLDDYAEDNEPGDNPQVPGVPTDMTAIGQKGTPATPGQVAAYEQNPGQRARS
jgi:hypothetical protein